ncbi:MarR family transcriptional regulator [Vibrio anguillarum]|uniref:MarR family transcriptional regulator n=1 Tax=Vibrio anguillarum TaxID=55601 RepID=A0ABR9Z9L1_VIBAN|nr:MarR family transcriptional regulator [Vibrio anguillarum]MBF4374410.1 MarR family transcriptional regulator [Vibrio anguillarum]
MYFGKGDIRRTLVVLCEIMLEKEITLNQLVTKTGMPKGTVQEQLKKLDAGQFPNVVLVKTGSIYSVRDEGSIINLTKLKKWYANHQKDC